MKTFIALYRGPTVSSAELVAVTANPDLVAEVARRLADQEALGEADPVLSSMERGRRSALQAIQDEATKWQQTGRFRVVETEPPSPAGPVDRPDSASEAKGD